MAGWRVEGCCNDISQITLQIYLVVQAGCQDGAASIAQRTSLTGGFHSHSVLYHYIMANW